MKKNVMMRVASIMLVLVLMTSSVISGTFAKYVTKGDSIDSARVAKWGVTVTANGTTFANAYKTDDGIFTEANSVIGQGGVNVVAPGTRGKMVSMALTGVPEVAARVSYVGVFDIENWVDQNGVYYCPLIIYVNGTKIDGMAYSNATAFEEAVNAAITGYFQDYAAGTDLSEATVGADALDVQWEWPFSTSADNDVRDTFLGDQANEGNWATVQLTVTTTVTQID